MTMQAGALPCRRTARNTLGLAAALLLVALLCGLSVAIGTREVGWDDIAAALAGRAETIGQAAVAARLAPVLPFLAAGFAISLLWARKLNALALGDELAVGLGENVARTRAIAGLGAILLCGATTAVCGPIGFVGLVVPHCCRLLVGTDHRWLLPFSALAGAGLLLVSDILGRILARPGELDVGIVTAFVGAPFFIWIVRRQRLRAL